LLHQGDIIWINPGKAGESVGLTGSSIPVALISQACDISRRDYCLVAPVEQPENTVLTDAIKGRRPLLVPLKDDSGEQWVANVGRAFPIPKAELSSPPRRCSDSDQGETARTIRDRIARAYGRFPFPGEVHNVFKPLRDKIHSKVGGSGAFGQVIDLLSTIRVSAKNWEMPERQLQLFLIVPCEYFIKDEDAASSWNERRVEGWNAKKDSFSSLSLDRTCELLLLNLKGDKTTLLKLWRKFGDCVYSQLVKPHLNRDVATVLVTVLSDEDFTYRQYARSESLDLEALSDAYTEDRSTPHNTQEHLVEGECRPMDQTCLTDLRTDITQSSPNVDE